MNPSAKEISVEVGDEELATRFSSGRVDESESPKNFLLFFPNTSLEGFSLDSEGTWEWSDEGTEASTVA
jgi:hypothetical protein